MEIELMDKCQHEDCVYRGTIEAGKTPVCNYALVEGRVRGCPISECSKYKSGKKIKPRLREDISIFWEREFYE